MVIVQKINHIKMGKMGIIRQINIKNRTYHFYNDIINLKKFQWILLKIDKKSYKNISIYNTRYIAIKKIDNCENIYSVNPLCMHVDQASGYNEEKNGNKYLIFDSTDENKELLKKYNDVWNKIKNEIRTIDGGKENDCEKNYIKIKFDSDADLSLNKPLKFHSVTIFIGSVFEEDGKLYPHVFLDDTLYELNI